jgi:hypothetical protein
VADLIMATGAKEVHIHLEKQEPSRMIFKQNSVFMGKPDQPEFEHTLTDWKRIVDLRSTIFK